MVAVVEPAGGMNHIEPVAGSLKPTAAVKTPGQLGLLPPPRTIVPPTMIGGPLVPSVPAGAALLLSTVLMSEAAWSLAIMIQPASATQTVRIAAITASFFR